MPVHERVARASALAAHPFHGIRRRDRRGRARAPPGSDARPGGGAGARRGRPGETGGMVRALLRDSSVLLPVSSIVSSSESIARRIRIRGIVQGVGFRPFVYRLARAHGLTGWVINGDEGVLIHVEGD